MYANWGQNKQKLFILYAYLKLLLGGSGIESILNIHCSRDSIHVILWQGEGKWEVHIDLPNHSSINNYCDLDHCLLLTITGTNLQSVDCSRTTHTEKEPIKIEDDGIAYQIQRRWNNLSDDGIMNRITITFVVIL